MKIKPVVLFVFSVFLCSVSLAQSNPFLSGQPAERKTSESEVSTPRGPSTWPVIGSFVIKSAAAQRELQTTIARAMADLGETGNMGNLWTLLGISFVFGILHAAGPGHRKTVLVAYFIGEGTKPLKGILAGFMLAAVHAASAIILVGGFYLFTTRSLLVSVDQAQTLLFPLTYGIILVLGIWMVVHGMKDYRSPQSPEKKNNSLGWLIFTGLVPCPAASAIMILAVAGNAATIGVVSVTAMSLGMGVLLAAVGLLAILMRDRMTALLKNPEAGRKLELVLQLLSGAAMALFGLFMGLGYL